MCKPACSNLLLVYNFIHVTLTSKFGFKLYNILPSLCMYLCHQCLMAIFEGSLQKKNCIYVNNLRL